jgi:hypothetical protein
MASSSVNLCRKRAQYLSGALTIDSNTPISAGGGAGCGASGGDSVARFFGGVGDCLAASIGEGRARIQQLPILAADGGVWSACNSLVLCV